MPSSPLGRTAAGQATNGGASTYMDPLAFHSNAAHGTAGFANMAHSSQSDDTLFGEGRQRSMTAMTDSQTNNLDYSTTNIGSMAPDSSMLDPAAIRSGSRATSRKVRYVNRPARPRAGGVSEQWHRAAKSTGHDE